MSLAEGVSARIAYKAYASGVITANTQATSSSALGASGGQIIRRVSSTINLTKDTYQSNEIRSDRQISDFRHGIKRVTGSLSGEFSPSTYKDWFEAAARGTWAAAVSKTQSEFTSVAATNATSLFTFGGGNPVTEGFRVGDIIQFANLSEAANNTKNFVIRSFGGSNNREVTVYPAPTDMGADTSFTVASQGKSLIVPSSSHVSRKFGIEVWNQDIDIARLFTECRVGGFTLQLPATGLATVEFPVMGRDMEVYDESDAPFFTNPTAATGTGIFAAVNGLLQVGGTTVGVVTGLNVQMNLNPSSDAVVGQNFVPEIYLGRANVTGQVTALFEDVTMINYFKNETEVSILAYLTTTSDASSPAVTIHLPRVKFGGADVQTSGESSQPITMPFQALLYNGTEASTGIAATTIRMCDTQVS
jgi:hypothetical protein